MGMPVLLEGIKAVSTAGRAPSSVVMLGYLLSGVAAISLFAAGLEL
eukprot:CAMPEP_0171878916 /NCGR_PEP_ID=MMETSP0992-20121227/37564_1 /TAXON_ID=483369 /ORGANISM="non described non described, Strain CCMP2098" /LENGTH=45 /DNA_ID= /DNA_START= /DNA_END= /DNA_ORIENTATION=